MSRTNSFKNFSPSFSLAGIPSLATLFENCWLQAEPGFLSAISSAAAGQDVFELKDNLPSSFGTSGSGWINHGHLPAPSSGGNVAGILSDVLPYTASVTFDGDDIQNVSLVLHLLNPRIFLSNGGFLPADYDPGTRQFTRLPTGSSTARANDVGLLIEQDPAPADPATRFARLSAGLDLATQLNPGVPGFQDLDQSTLIARLDLSMSWSKDWAQEKLYNFLGQALMLAGGSFPAGIQTSVARFFAPGLAGTFDGLLHKSKYLGLHLGDGSGAPANVGYLHEAPTGTGTPLANAYFALRREFGLKKDFRGLYVDQIGAHWLDPSGMGHHSHMDLTVSSLAVAMDGEVQDNHQDGAKWFASVVLTVDNDTRPAVFGIMERRLTLRASVAQGDLRFASLEGKIDSNANVPNVLNWLKDKDVAISLAKYSASGGDTDWGVEMAVKGDGSRLLAKLRNTSAVFKPMVTALVFGPIAVRSDALKADLALPPNDPKTRGYFAEIATPLEVAAIFAGASGINSIVFKNALEPKELRITDAYLRTQPRRVLDANADPDARDVALLFDYEADYAIQFTKGPQTARNVSTRVEGTGFGVDENGLRWVQVTGGLFDLSMNDPGLWTLGQSSPLGKILRVVSVSLRSFNPVELEIRVRLAGNFGVVKADDFVFRIDLSDANSKLVAYPSSVEVNVAKVVKGKGTLRISDRETASGQTVRQVVGGLDLSLLAAGLRMYGGLNLSKAESPAGELVTALVASAEVEFAKPIPIGSSGLGLKQIGALFAQNMIRLEPAQQGSVFPALGWYKAVGGDVVKSVSEHSELWGPEYDRWSFGIGAGVELLAGSRLMNLNSMLVVDIPGPVISLFSKVNLLTKPKSSKALAQGNKLTAGILGVLQLNFLEKSLTLGVYADINLAKLAKIRGSLETRFNLRHLPDWHYFFGHPSSPILVELDLGAIIKADAIFYFIAAGDELTGLPSPLPATLDGFALALGLGANIKIGGGSLYLKIGARVDVALSLSDVVFTRGVLSFYGEFRLFIVSIGVSGGFDFEYLRQNPTPPNQFHMAGEVCGKVDLGLFDISGCLSFEIGSTPSFDPDLPALPIEANLFSRAQTALLGAAGIAGAVDSVVAQADGSLDRLVPLDCTLVLELSAPPKRKMSGPVTGSFDISQLAPAAVRTDFNLGGQLGHYRLNEVSLKKSDGTEVPIPQDTVHWWRTGTNEGGGQPAPISLAMLTRNPLGYGDAMTDPQAVKDWIDAILGDPCADVAPARDGFYRLGTDALLSPDSTAWSFPGCYCDTSNAPKPDVLGAAEVSLVVQNLDLFPRKPLEAVALFPGGERLPMLRLNRVLSNEVEPTPVRIDLRLDSFGHESELVLLMSAEELRSNIELFSFQIEYTDGTLEPASPYKIVSLVTDAEAVHLGCPDWSAPIMHFTQITELPGLADQQPTALIFKLKSNLDARRLSLLDNGLYQQRVPAFLFGLITRPTAERARYEKQLEIKNATQTALKTLFSPDPVPLLEPATNYVLEIDHSPSIGAPGGPNRFEFRTAEHPPEQLTHHLLASLPGRNSGRHYHDLPVGLVLSSPDILRVLAAFDARLKVTIRSDAKAEVTDSSGTLDWHSGVIVDPASLQNQLSAPLGFEPIPVQGLPNALLDAILAQSKAGKLDCLGELKLPDTALWLGFDVVLEASMKYMLTIEILNAADQPWNFPADAALPADALATREPFFELPIATSRHATTSGHAAAITGFGHRNRLCLSDLELPTKEGAGLHNIPDKVLEDAVVAATGTQLNLTDLPQTTLLWRDTGTEIVPYAVLVVSDESLKRGTPLPTLVEETLADGRRIRNLEPRFTAFSAPDPTKGFGFDQLYLNSGGTVLLAVLSEDVGATGVQIHLQEVRPDLIPNGLSDSGPLVDLPPALLGARATG